MNKEEIWRRNAEWGIPPSSRDGSECNGCHTIDTNDKWNSNIVMGCWLESKLVAARWGGQQVSSHDHSNTIIP